MLLFWFIIILLIVLNGYFSLAEIALVSVNKGRLTEEAEEGNQQAARTLSLLNDPEEFLSSIQVGITLVGIIEGLYGGERLALWVSPVLLRWGMHANVAHITGLVLSIGIITYITIVLGELIPKSLALQFPHRTALFISTSLYWFTRLTYPFVKLLTVSTQLLLKAFGIKNDKKETITEGDLRTMLSTAYKQGILEKNELKLHQNVFNFNDLKAQYIMTPRHLVVALRDDMSREEMAVLLRKYDFTCFPVYHDDKDRITGVIMSKEFFMYPEKSLAELLKVPCFIAIHQPLPIVFQQFQVSMWPFGVVVNEFGNFEGVITIYDVGSALFGNLRNTGKENPYLQQQSPKTWIAPGAVRLYTLKEALGIDWVPVNERQFLTLAAMLLEKWQRIPTEGEEIAAHNVKFKILKMEDHRIEKVLITLP
ncbi:putative hemolysin [Chitinophaga costaii]|uniref:Putative hemolysin n=1 Tax=Chitinophaga costaii TaxID=1335309 RepID=A0A1C4CIJ2_9BACT|nr:hemolysin family protein [Chitinophaga costaii]PUZ27077.1 HlyC/CorC family transporter [Chitinophaga costaii]SCC18864.1 putative hemolysin [Chitinophaga costaii]